MIVEAKIPLQCYYMHYNYCHYHTAICDATATATATATNQFNTIVIVTATNNVVTPVTSTLATAKLSCYCNYATTAITAIMPLPLL